MVLVSSFLGPETNILYLFVGSPFPPLGIQVGGVPQPQTRL